MALHLKIVSEHSELAGESRERHFDETGGTIGRSIASDWVLPDPERYVSGRHATIDYKAGVYYLLDTSSNGVYFNDEVEPVGRGSMRRIFDGDRLRMGNFEFAVSIESGESIEVPLDSEFREPTDNSLQRVEEESHNSDLQLLDEEEITGDEEFQQTLFGSDRRKKKQPAANVAANDADSSIDSAAAAPAPPAVAAGGGALFDAFISGLGVSPDNLHPALDQAAMLETAGSTLREMLQGIISLLASRANLKNAFRLDQTTVLPRANNPLKFSESADDLLMQLLLGSEGDYLGATDAVREVCRDLLNHQNAFLDAMNAAFIEFADRFAPDELQEGFDRTMSGFTLLSLARKAKYWDLYTELYPVMTEKGGGRFPQMFGEEFVRAYERQIAEYRRHSRDSSAQSDPQEPAFDPGLLETRRLDQSDLAAETQPAKIAPGSRAADAEEGTDGNGDTGSTDDRIRALRQKLKA